MGIQSCSYRGLVRAGAMGAAAPITYGQVNFRRNTSEMYILSQISPFSYSFVKIAPIKGNSYPGPCLIVHRWINDRI